MTTGTTSIAICPAKYGSKETILRHLIISKEGTFPPLLRLALFPSTGGLLVWGRSGISAPCRLQSVALLWIWAHAELMPSRGCRKWIYRECRSWWELLHCQDQIPRCSGWAELTAQSHAALRHPPVGSLLSCSMWGRDSSRKASVWLKAFCKAQRSSPKNPVFFVYLFLFALVMFCFVAISARQFAARDEGSSSRGKAQPAPMFSLGQPGQKKASCRNPGRIWEHTRHLVWVTATLQGYKLWKCKCNIELTRLGSCQLANKTELSMP